MIDWHQSNSLAFPLHQLEMKRVLQVILLFTLLSWLGQKAIPAPYPDRLVWVFGWGLERDGDVAAITNVLAQAAGSGLSGAVLSAGLDSLCKRSPAYFHRLAQVQQSCQQLGLELIPSVFSVGYGGGTLSHDRHLAEGLPVKDAPFVADGTKARFVPDTTVQISNGGFEEFSGDQFKGFNFHDQPGEISFADKVVKHSGQAALRLENFKANPHGHGRIMQEAKVDPHRAYRMTIWVRTEGLKPANAFRLLVLAGDRDLAPRTFDLPPSTDWRKFTMLFNSLDRDSVRLYAGLWGGKEGTVWLDDWTIEEAGPLNVLRRPGTPVTVRSEDGANTYEEGKDYAPLLDPNHNARPNYYLVQGDYTGSWNHVPKDLVMAVWGGSPREKSLRFFAEHGFSILVACYYDADDMRDVQAWLQLARDVTLVRGFMYTPWTRKYELLPDFGQLLRASPCGD
jgi:hypothetical protein